jgi:pyruvate dehydrogenase E2 component (dihydrolipoamide acetyltransferase)
MSDIKTLEMPKWGLSMEEGVLARWAIQEGDRFTKGQEICEIETSKIVNVLEAPFAGTLRRIIARVGDTLPVGAVLALVADASVSDAELDAFAASLARRSQQRLARRLPSLRSGRRALRCFAPPISLRHPLGRPRSPSVCKA